MEVILLEKVHGLGELGETVKVKPGFARNFLIPGRKAITATRDNRARIELARAELEAVQIDALSEAKARAAALAEISITLRSRAGAEGRLFGSIGTADIARAVTESGLPLTKKEIRLPHGPLREIGEHEVQLHLHPEVDAPLKIVIAREDERPVSD
ncbi:MAG: 50S ribosomal protein L9 [Gammaproteobacteria bacterium]